MRPGVHHHEGMPSTSFGIPDRYLDALAKVTTWERDSNELALSGPGGELRYEEVGELPPWPLTETRWELNGVAEGSTAEPSVSSPFPAHLILKEDGTFTATTGCRKVSGRWKETDEGIETSDVELGRKRCAEFRFEQDARIVEALQEGFVSIEENEMTVTSSSGYALLYRTND